MKIAKFYLYNYDELSFYLVKSNSYLIFIGSPNQTINEFYNFYPEDNYILQTAVAQLFINETQQLDAYFSGEIRKFNLLTKVDGSQFQKDVWQLLCSIPYGQVLTYKQIAIKLNKPSASRAVATAIAKNPLLIIIPCHRVIGSDSKLRGYRGGLDTKKKLLYLENIKCQFKL